MKRRKFIKNSLLTAGVVISGAVGACQDFDSVEKNIDYEYIEYDKRHKFRVIVSNVHSDYYKNSVWKNIVVENDSLHPFSFEQGEFALMLLPLTGGAVKSLLYKYEKNKYILIGRNIGNGEKSGVHWPEAGIEIDIKNISKA